MGLPKPWQKVIGVVERDFVTGLVLVFNIPEVFNVNSYDGEEVNDNAGYKGAERAGQDDKDFDPGKGAFVSKVSDASKSKGCSGKVEDVSDDQGYGSDASHNVP